MTSHRKTINGSQEELSATLGASLTDTLKMININQCDFTDREKTKILNKITQDYLDRHDDNHAKPKLFEVDTRKV